MCDPLHSTDSLNFSDKTSAIYEIYFFKSEWQLNRSDIEGFNSNTTNNSTRRVTMTTAKMYCLISNEVIGEMVFSRNAVESQNPLVLYNIDQNLYNIFEKLIIPNHSMGYISTQNQDPSKVKFFFSPKSWTQDILGKRVLIAKLPDDEVDKIKWRVEVFDEDF